MPIDLHEPDSDTPAEGAIRIQTAGNEVEASPASMRALALASSLRSEEGQLHLVHATPALDRSALLVGHTGIAGALAEVHKSAQAMAVDALEQLARIAVPQQSPTFAARSVDAIELILSEAQSVEADLIVLPTSGRSRVARFFLGSTADRVIRSAKCPVLVVPARIS